jgi:hypothetical protein
VLSVEVLFTDILANSQRTKPEIESNIKKITAIEWIPREIN